jgi:CRP/FNR family transcriptional regulator, cyclic AMP receptor protein
VQRDPIAARLADLGLFADVPWPDLEAIAHTFEEGVFAAGQRVLREGLGGGALYIVLEGRGTVLHQGNEITLVERGDFFGETSVLLGETPSADVRADTLLRCLVVPGQAVESFLLDHPKVMLRMLKAEARRLRGAIEWR